MAPPQEGGHLAHVGGQSALDWKSIIRPAGDSGMCRRRYGFSAAA